MYKILVLKNRVDVPIEDDMTKAVEYFKKRNIDVSFEYKDISEPVSTKFYMIATDGNRYHGIEDSVKDSCDKYVEKGKYHAVIFAWNTKDVPVPTDGQLTSWTNWGTVSVAKQDTEFIQLITNGGNDTSGWIYVSVIHEIMHSFCKRLSRRGFIIWDEMDLTIMPDGQQIPYYKNSLPDEPDSNFGQTFDNLKPFVDKLYDFYWIEKEKPTFQTLKVGMRSDSVLRLQIDLRSLGYFKYYTNTAYFGEVTKKAIMAFQKDYGVPQTGNYGPLTDKALQEVKKNGSLINAIIQVESRGNDFAIGDVNLVHKAYGSMQIRQPVCDDVNKKFGTKLKAQDMLGNRTLSIDTYKKYISIYAEGRSDEFKARVWNGGPLGFQKTATIGYWEKVKKYLPV